MLSEIISLISVILALIAVFISTWQARSNIQHARHSRSLPVIAESFKEFRYPEFRESIHNLLTLPMDKMAGNSFATLTKDRREDAYKVCYFFDYIGTLIAFGIIREDIIIATMGTPIMQVWSAMSPIIEKERAYRRETYSSKTPPGFLTFYEHLVACVDARGGREAARIIQEQIGVRSFSAATNNEESIQGPSAPQAPLP
jgi:hypothetical protein